MNLTRVSSLQGNDPLPLELGEKRNAPPDGGLAKQVALGILQMPDGKLQTNVPPAAGVGDGMRYSDYREGRKIISGTATGRISTHAQTPVASVHLPNIGDTVCEVGGITQYRVGAVDYSYKQIFLDELGEWVDFLNDQGHRLFLIEKRREPKVGDSLSMLNGAGGVGVCGDSIHEYCTIDWIEGGTIHVKDYVGRIFFLPLDRYDSVIDDEPCWEFVIEEDENADREEVAPGIFVGDRLRLTEEGIKAWLLNGAISLGEMVEVVGVYSRAGSEHLRLRCKRLACDGEIWVMADPSLADCFSGRRLPRSGWVKA